MTYPKKILMVCLGNICRSPLAEGVMRQVAAENGLHLVVDSAGTSGYHIGEAPDPRSVTNARKNGINIANLRARQFSATDFDAFDWIYVMDNANYKDVIKLARNDEERNKVSLLLLAANAEKAPVPDPYYGTEKDFQHVFNLVKGACENIAAQLKALR
jgi:protein-tyrosine phosphatase